MKGVQLMQRTDPRRSSLDSVPRPQQATIPTPSSDQLDSLRQKVATLRDQLVYPGQLQPAELAQLTRLVAEVGRQGPTRLIEFGFGVVSELLAQLLARLQLVITHELRQQDQSGSPELPARVQQLLPTADSLGNLLMRLAESHAKFNRWSSRTDG
jgi:hypothetical protein